MKELCSLRYGNGGGLVDERDFKSVYIEFYMTKYEKSCLCNIRIGNKNISKEFTDKNYPILNNVCDLLNKVNYDEIEQDFEKSLWLDAPSSNLQYKYSFDEEYKEIANPNCKGLLSLLNDFIDDYLLKDNELQAIFKSIIECNDTTCDYTILKSVLKNENTFDINKDYEVDKINNVKPREINFENKQTTNKTIDNNVTIDDLIAKTDEKIAEIDNE